MRTESEIRAVAEDSEEQALNYQNRARGLPSGLGNIQAAAYFMREANRKRDDARVLRWVLGS